MNDFPSCRVDGVVQVDDTLIERELALYERRVNAVRLDGLDVECRRVPARGVRATRTPGTAVP